MLLCQWVLKYMVVSKSLAQVVCSIISRFDKVYRFMIYRPFPLLTCVGQSYHWSVSLDLQTIYLLQSNTAR